MTTKPKPVHATLGRHAPVTLFGRRMRYSYDCEIAYRLGAAVVSKLGNEPEPWLAFSPGISGNSGWKPSPHAAARALERKIESQWKRLGKLMGKAK